MANMKSCEKIVPFAVSLQEGCLFYPKSSDSKLTDVLFASKRRHKKESVCSLQK